MKKNYIYRELFISLLGVISIGCACLALMFILLALFEGLFSRDGALGIIFLVSSLVMILFIRSIRRSETTQNMAILKSLKNKLFQPEEHLELYKWKMGKYIGFDDKNKTILALDLYNKNTLIKAIDFNTWSGYECRGSVVTFKFRDINFPTFIMGFRSEGESMAFCHKLDVLLTPEYKPASNVGHEFSEYIKTKQLTFQTV
ncbi:hypothetical protein OE847_003801 [Salmonella enterica]|nr:hypothetical protein [Salmonella enterica]EDX0904375.1 hypothetical protein [Salmonella enterica subsp. enterica]EBD7338845.1 hypothetical protein [Salmonella enterica]ECP2053116.1 hypothetical protein [Salmonella enterica]ECX5291124.1 hypothetical protein [Salmonella enterica]